MADRTSLSRPGVIGAAVGLTLLASGVAQAHAPRLLVFLHVSLKQRAFQSLLGGSLAGVDVTAVGRIADFERSLTEAPDAVLTLPLVMAAKNLSPSLRGQRSGASEERYVLVAADAAPDPARVKTVGTLDILGREGTTAFANRLLGSNTKVERVTKVEDLLPLLQMQRVDAILMPERLIDDVKSGSRLNLVPRPLERLVGLPALAAIGAGASAISAGISRLPAKVLQTMGVDSWH